MTIGPEPMMSTRLISVLFGMYRGWGLGSGVWKHVPDPAPSP
jgi:hypothetical protein